MLSELIEVTNLVIWDEALMTDRKAFEALDRSFRDIEKAHNLAAASIPFGGKVVVLGRDLRQILPVVEGGSKIEVLNSTITNSRLCSHIEMLSLNENMRLQCPTADSSYQQEIAEFSKWILEVDEGTLPCIAKEGETEPSWIKIPRELLLTTDGDKFPCIVNAIYLDFNRKFCDPAYLADRAILTPTNELTDTVNDYVVSLVQGQEKEYLSSVSIAKSTGLHEAYDLLYPVEFLNSINGNNFPHHRITLKEGVPIMLLQNLNQSAGLCNGTKLIVTALAEWSIEARIMNGRHKNQSFIIPRITLSMKSNKCPFVLQRRQYPVKVCYGMTINRSQGQTLSAVGVYLKRPVFTHGQLYVTISRVTTKQGPQASYRR